MCERRGELSGGSPAGRKRKLKVQLERGRAPKSHDDKLRLPQRSNGVHECGVPFVGARRRRRSGGAAAVSSRASSHMQREWMVQLVECREPLRRVRRAPSTMCAGSALRRCRRLHRCQRRASEQRSCPNERAACTPSSSAANPASRVQPASAAPDPRRDCPDTWQQQQQPGGRLHLRCARLQLRGPDAPRAQFGCVRRGRSKCKQDGAGCTVHTSSLHLVGSPTDDSYAFRKPRMTCMTAHTTTVERLSLQSGLFRVVPEWARLTVSGK